MNKYEKKEKFCPICNGLVYKKGYVGSKVYQCIRCERWFSLTELDKVWLEDFKNGI